MKETFLGTIDYLKSNATNVNGIVVIPVYIYDNVLASLESLAKEMGENE